MSEVTTWQDVATLGLILATIVAIVWLMGRD